MKEPADLAERIRAAATSDRAVHERARRIAELILAERGYRWVGIYRVDAEEIVNVAWSGPTAPAHLRFPRTAGLCGAAAAGRKTVVAQDVAADSRYLETLGSTRSEIVVPIFDRGNPRAVVGIVDVESDRPGAFGEEDQLFLERCAEALADFPF